MKYRNVTPARIGRKTNRAVALALALALGGGVAATAMARPSSMGQTQHTSAAEQQAQQARAARQAQHAANVARASAQPMGATLYVDNCYDSGYGSLRDTVADAASGDTIDMTTMSCNQINLSSNITVDQHDLTLLGKSENVVSRVYRPITNIHASANDRVFFHLGTGTLTLESIDLSDAHISGYWGGCIYSAGNVKLLSSYVHDCSTTQPVGSSGDIKGGAIYADGKVTLSGSDTTLSYSVSVVRDNVATAADGNADGGGIYAGGSAQLESQSRVYDNLAESANGNANGGGIYGESYVDLTKSSSVVRDNKAETHSTGSKIKGAGIYSESDSQIHGQVTGNEANYVVNGTVYIGEGVGIFTERGVDAYPGAKFNLISVIPQQV